MANIDIEKLDKLTAEADKIFITPEGEEVLIQLLEIQDQVNAAIEEAKAKLEATALKVNPDFSSIQADKIKVFYREYGSKYYLDESQIELVPEGLVTEKTSYAIDSKAVEKWADEHDGMPTGIKEVERKKSLSFSLKNNGKTND